MALRPLFFKFFSECASLSNALVHLRSSKRYWFYGGHVVLRALLSKVKKLCEAVSTGECCDDVSATVLLVLAATVVLVSVDVAGLVVLIVHSVMYRNIVLCSAEA